MTNCVYIWIFISALILGIIDIFIRVRKTIREDSDILEFWKTIKILYDNIEENRAVDNESYYIISKSKYIDKLLTNNSLYSPVFNFTSDISKGEYNNAVRYLDLVRKYIIQNTEDNRRKRLSLWWSLLNPIELFCRGIEISLRYCLSYFISLLKSNFDYNGKPWKVIVGIISLISAILTILGFFGVTFNTMNL